MLSIIIPCHNDSIHLRKALNNLKSFNINDMEIIIVDDASTDETPEIVKGYGLKAIRLNENKGPVAARNIGAHAARGEVLFFVDSDVYLNSCIPARLMSLLRNYPSVAGISFIYSLEHPNKNLISLYKNFAIRMEEMDKPNRTSYFRFSAFAIRKKAFDAIGGLDDAPCCEELAFTLKIKEHNLIFYLDKETNVIHAKHYTFGELVKGDFRRAINYFTIFFNNLHRIQRNYSNITRSFNIPLGQLVGVGLAGLFFVSSFFYATGINLILCFLMVLMLFVLQIKFLKSAYKAYGFVFAFAAFLLRNLELVIGEIAMIIAMVNFRLKKYKGKLLPCLFI